MEKNNRQRTEEFISKANQEIDGEAKLLVVNGNEKIDLLEVTNDWIKFRSKNGKSTYILEKDQYIQIIEQMTRTVADSIDKVESQLSQKFKKRISIKEISDNRAHDAVKMVSEWWKDMAQKIIGAREIPSLLGPYKDLEREITEVRSFSTNEPIESADIKTCKIDSLYFFFIDSGSRDLNTGNEIWNLCFPPLIACGVKITKKTDSNLDESAIREAKIMKYILEKDSPLNDIIVDMNEESMTSLDETDMISDSGSACSSRRMKLFAAAKHYGADIFKKNGWIAAVCWTYEQCHVFGRLKPKVKPGTNEIDPDCNLEDWEGITPENKAKRDDWTLPWIKDGIDDGHGKSFDYLSGESGQPKKSFGCESAWCNCGVLNGDGTWIARDRTNPYFAYYNNGGKTPYLILMDMSRGALYQYVHIKNRGDIINFLNEDDKIDGGRLGNPPDRDQMMFFREFCEENQGFAEFISELDAKYY